jgi:hypothetical protein
MRLSACILAAILLLGCAESKQEAAAAADEAIAQASEAVAEQSEQVQSTGAATTTPLVLAMRDAVDSITTEPLPEPVASIDPAVVALVVRWEVGGPAQYVRKYQGVICPGGASGPTVGIGFDLGTQTPAEIRAAWASSPYVDALASGSGVVGPDACNAWRAQHQGIRIPYDDAIRTFTAHDWPRYSAMAARAYRNGWAGLTYPHQAALTSNGYNRGFSFLGSRRTEMREIRDTCVPGNDAPCTAGQLRTSCRVWDSQPDIRKGLCARRYSEADFSLL